MTATATSTGSDTESHLQAPAASVTKPGSEGQTFLVGDTLYLRGPELADAARPAAWRDSPFPVPKERAEEILKKDLPSGAERYKTTLVACRRADDEPVGGLTYQVWGWRTADLQVWADRAFGPAAAEIRAEIIRLVVPWLLQERHLMALYADVEGGEPIVATALASVGARPAARLRDAVWRDGQRHDHYYYEALHPAWVQRLGDPRASLDGVDPGVAPPVLRPRRPPITVAADQPRPRNAVMLGQRVYLRALEPEDAEQIARWSRQETETFFDNGRQIRNPITFAHFSKKGYEDDPPEHVEFAVVLRDGDELIGEVGLYDISWVHRTAETGSYLYRPDRRSGGLGSEAKHLLLDYAFNRINLHMVRSFVWSPNTRSAAALRKQGYRDAGRLSWTSLREADFVDDLVFDLLATEWRAGEVESGQ